MIKPTRTCILVADSRVAKFFANEGPGKGLAALADLTLQSNDSTEKAPADRPGRVFDRSGRGRHAMEPPTDPATKRTDEFLRQATDVAATQVRNCGFDQLILVAPPKVMAGLRTSLPNELRGSLRAELVKDLTHLSTADLIQHLDEVLAVSPAR